MPILQIQISVCQTKKKGKKQIYFLLNDVRVFVLGSCRDVDSISPGNRDGPGRFGIGPWDFDRESSRGIFRDVEETTIGRQVLRVANRVLCSQRRPQAVRRLFAQEGNSWPILDRFESKKNIYTIM